MFCYKNTFTRAIYLKIGKIVDFDVKKSEMKFQTGSAIFYKDDVMIDKGHILLGDSTVGGLLPHFLFVFF